MSKEGSKIEEKSKEINSEELNNEEENDKPTSIKGIEKKPNTPIIPKLKTKGYSLKELNLKNPRLSCQPTLSFVQRHGSNFSIRPVRTRKKTTITNSRNTEDDLNLPPYMKLKSCHNIGSSIIKEEESFENKITKRNSNLNNYISTNSNNTTHDYEINSKNIGFIKLSRKSNLYEREKKRLKRKENYIKKKQKLKFQEYYDNARIPLMNKNSEIIMNNKSGYIPIEYRATKLYKCHLFESKINEYKKRNKKIEEENKEYEIVKQYNINNKKKFNKDDWEQFIRNQEFWNKEKIYKRKAAELIRNNIEQRNNYIPEINKNSKLMIKTKRRKLSKDKNDNIYIKLYNDFGELQERKKMRICNSMPSFKPLLNKSVKKNVFSPKKKNNKSTKKLSEKYDLLIKAKLNKSKSINNLSNVPTKYTSVSHINNSKIKNNYNNYIFNNNKLLNNSLKNKNKNSNRYDNTYFEELISMSNYNETNNSKNKVNKPALYKNILKYNNINNGNKKKNVYNRNCVNKLSYEYFFNRNSNSLFFSSSNIIKEEK